MRQRLARVEAAVGVERGRVVHASCIRHCVYENPLVGSGERAENNLHPLRSLVRRLIEEPQHWTQDYDDLCAGVKYQIAQNIFVEVFGNGISPGVYEYCRGIR